MNMVPGQSNPDSHGISQSGNRAALSLSSVPRASSVLARMGALSALREHRQQRLLASIIFVILLIKVLVQSFRRT